MPGGVEGGLIIPLSDFWQFPIIILRKAPGNNKKREVYLMSETEQQRKEREYQEDLQRLRDFRPIDDDFM